MKKKHELLKPGDMVGRLQIKKILTREEAGRPPTKNGDHKYFYEVACIKCPHARIMGADSIMARKKDCPRCLVDDRYIGKKFNTLTVVRRHEKKSSSRNFYEAVCTCGRTIIRNDEAFRSESSYCRKCTPRNKTVTWDKRENLVGCKIGKINVLEFIDVVQTSETEPNRIYKCQIEESKKTIILPRYIIVRTDKYESKFQKLHTKKLSQKECNHIRAMYESKMYSFVKLRVTYDITVTQLLNIIFNPHYRCD